METVVAVVPLSSLNFSHHEGATGAAGGGGGGGGGVGISDGGWLTGGIGGIGGVGDRGVYVPDGSNLSGAVLNNYTWIGHKTRTPEYLAYSGAGAVGGQVLAVLVVMVMAVLGNFLMCYAVYRTPSLHIMANLFTINLGLSDLSLAAVVLPVWMQALVSGAANPRGSPPFSAGLCQGVAFVTVLLLLVSISTLAGISLDRYFIICHPLRYPMEMTTRRVCLLLLWVWVQSALLAAAPLAGWGRYDFRPQTIPICNPAWAAAPGHATCIVIVGMVTPFCVMIFSYTRVVKAARRQWARIAEIQRQLAQSSINTYGGGSSSDEEDPSDVAEVGRGFRSRPSIFRRLLSRKGSVASLSSSYSNIAKNVRTLKTIFIVVGVFFVCWGPYVVAQLWSAHHPERPLPYAADLCTTLLAFSNSAINPFMFMLLNRDFRYALSLMVARLMQLLGEEEAVHKAKLRGHRDSCIESFRLHSRASVDSGVVMEMKGDTVLRPPPAAVPVAPRDRMPDSYLSEAGVGPAGHRRPPSLPMISDAAEVAHDAYAHAQSGARGSPRNSQQQQRWLLDAPIPPSYNACARGTAPLQPLLLTVPSLIDEVEVGAVRGSLRQLSPEGPTFIVPNVNIPIIVIGGEPLW